MRALELTQLPLSVVLLIAFTTSAAHAIIIRHNVDPAIYGSQGVHYPSVMTFLWPAEEGTAEAASLSATLLSHDWAVTAAHGTDEFQQKALRIEVGGVLYQDVAFDIWASHPCFDDTASPHDLGLVHFPNPPWPALERYPSLYNREDELGKVVVFVGRGASGTGAEGSDGEPLGAPFRNATNTIDHVSEDVLRFTFNAPNEEEVSPLEGISGDGDSGGPAFMCAELSLDPLGRIACSGRVSLLGVSAYQAPPPGTSAAGVYGVTEHYTRISTHRSWLTQVMATGDAGACIDAMPQANTAGDHEATSLSVGCQGAHQPPFGALLVLLCLPWIRRCRRALVRH
jgi:hypothetical protein